MRSFPDFKLQSPDNTCRGTEANAEQERRGIGWVDRKDAPKFQYVLQSQPKVALKEVGQLSLLRAALAFAWWTAHRVWLNLASRKFTPWATARR